MEKQLKKILIGMLVEFTRKEILEKEIIYGGKKGLQKLEAVKENFFEKFKSHIKKSQEVNNSFIPDDIEIFAEDLLLSGAEKLQEIIKIDEIIEKILSEEKKEIGI